MNYLLCDMVGTLTWCVLLRTIMIASVICGLVMVNSGYFVVHPYESKYEICVNAADVQDYKDCLAERNEWMQPIHDVRVSVSVTVNMIVVINMLIMTAVITHFITEIRTVHRTSWLNAAFGFKFNNPDKEQLQMRPNWQI